MVRPTLFSLLLTAAAFAEAPPAAKTTPLVSKETLEKAFANKPVEIHLDMPYAGTSNPKQMLDLFLPRERKTDKPLPVIAYIHGGGWVNGDRKSADHSMAVVAMSGNYAGISIGYRLSGEAKWPAQIHDCKAAIRWIRGHAKEYNLDPDHIGVWGTSAGGHLVSLLGVSPEVKELNGDEGEFNDLSNKVTCVVNICGPQDMTGPLMQGEAGKKDDPALSGLFGSPLKDHITEEKAASPLSYVSASSAPFLTAQGTNDQRVNFTNAQRIDEALRKAGVTSILFPVEGGGHSFHSTEVDKAIQQFFDLHLRGIKSEIVGHPVPDEPRATAKTKAKES